MSRAVEMVKDAMARHAMNQSQLARDAGISRQYLNQVLHGHRPFSADAAQRIGDVLGISWRSIIIAQAEGRLDRAR